MENEQAVRDKITLLSHKVVQLEQVVFEIQAEAIRLGGGEVQPPLPPIHPAGAGPDLIPVLDQIEGKLNTLTMVLQQSLSKFRAVTH